MKSLNWLVAFLVASSISLMAWSEDSVAPRIIGGTPTTEPHAYFVALMIPWSWTGNGGGSHWNPVCGGTYIGDGLVVTAAHCLDDFPNGATIALAFGNQSQDMAYEFCSDRLVNQDCITRSSPDDNVTGYHFTGYVAYTGNNQVSVTLNNQTRLMHPNYRPRTFENDIAVIRLPNSVGAGTLLLPDSQQWETLVSANANVRVIGHGNTFSARDTSDFRPSADLQQVDVTARSDSVCTNDYGNNYRSNVMLCAGNPNPISPNTGGKDSCQGDSGGPLFHNGILHGIVSWGGQCAVQHGVYTNVLAMRSWLDGIILVAQDQASFPWELDFGSEAESLDKTLSWTFTNEGSGAVTLSNFQFASGSGFTGSTSACERTLTGGESCTISVTANLTSVTSYRSSFTFEMNNYSLTVGLKARVTAKSSNRFGSSGGATGFWLAGLMLPLLLWRNRRTLMAVPLLALFLSGCAAWSNSADPEVVFNPEIQGERLSFSVVSTGCTHEDQLYLRIRGDKIEVRRTEPDLCRAAPQLKRFEMPLPEAAGVWQLVNPVRYSNRVIR